MQIKHAFVGSDQHFGSHKIAHLRGYESHQEFTQKYIDAHNASVQAHNAVIFLGDSFMTKDSLEIVKKLNGSIHLVLGNHDPFKAHEYLAAGIKSVSAMLTSSDQKVVLTHYPVHETFFRHNQKDWINFHGHLHSDFAGPQHVNCCIEQSLVPLSLPVWVEKHCLKYIN
jgi:calcineurin-like phosphoesterase family protein